MNKQADITKKSVKRKTKGVHIELSEQDYALMEERMNRRGLDKTNYFKYLIRKDKDDFQCQGAADTMNKISAATVGLLENCDKCQCQGNQECAIRPFVVNISEGVEGLWQYLR